MEEGETRYLTEDYAFCWRCTQIGIPSSPTRTIRLTIWEATRMCWEEASGMTSRVTNASNPISSPHVRRAADGGA